MDKEQLIQIRNLLEKKLEKRELYKPYTCDAFLPDEAFRLYSDSELNPSDEHSREVARNYAMKAKSVLDYIINNNIDCFRFDISIGFAFFINPTKKIVDNLNIDQLLEKDLVEFYGMKSYHRDKRLSSYDTLEEIYDLLPIKQDILLVSLDSYVFYNNERTGYDMVENNNVTFLGHDANIVSFEPFMKELHELGFDFSFADTGLEKRSISFKNTVIHALKGDNCFYECNLYKENQKQHNK